MPDPVPSVSIPAPTSAMRLWLTEAVRLREAHWGPLEDERAVREARLAAPDLVERIHVRAHVLGETEKLPQRLEKWRTGGWLAFAALAVFALLAGSVAGGAALGDGTRTVNVVWAVGALLGLHALTFLIWLISLCWPTSRTGGSPANAGLGGIWLWLTRKVARGPQAALIPSAFVNVLAYAGIRRAFFGAISHALWSLALGASLLTLIVLLSTARYHFAWATTLLSPEKFVLLTQTLGAIPGYFGFPTPDAALVRASDGRIDLPAIAQTQWSLWLLGIVTIYGLLVRVVACVACTLYVRHALARVALDPNLPGYSELRDRLMPSEQPLGIDRPSDAVHEPHVPDHSRIVTDGQTLVAALELPAERAWPPSGLLSTPADASVDAGRLDTGEQRRRLLDALAAKPAAKLLLVCDAQQTPDRGTMGLIADLARYTGQLGVWLAEPADHQGMTHTEPSVHDAAPSRRLLWTSALQRTGLSAKDIVFNEPAARQWLEPAQ